MFLEPDQTFPEMNIRDRFVGYHHKPLIIVEIGINHFGSVKNALRLVDIAADAGAEIIKVQLHNANFEMSSHAQSVKPGNADSSIFDVIMNNELTFKEEELVRKHVADLGLLYAATPFSREAVDFLRDQDPDAVKIGSGEADHVPLIELICGLQKPIIMSTGMHSVASIVKSVEALRNSKLDYSLLHCTNLYPMPPNLARLEGIRELMKDFPDAVIGYSDHASGNLISYAAIGLGAAIVERHFVESLSDEGPDVSASVDPHLLQELLAASDTLHQARGGYKSRSVEEEVTYNFARSSVLATQQILKGEQFTWDNTWAIRPGTGDISVSDIDLVVGKKAVRDVSEKEQIKWEDVESHD